MSSYLPRVNFLCYRYGAVGGFRGESHKLSCSTPSRVEPLQYETRAEGGWELLVFMGCPIHPEYIFHNIELVGMAVAPGSNVTDSHCFYWDLVDFSWINASKFIVVFDSFSPVLSLFFWGEDLLNSLYIHFVRPISYIRMFWQQWLNSSCSVKESDSLNLGENYQSSHGNQLPLAVFPDDTCCLSPLLKWMVFVIPCGAPSDPLSLCYKCLAEWIEFVHL